MKKKQKIKVVKNVPKGLPKDLTKTMQSEIRHDPRIPAVGSIITKKYKGEVLEVKVLENGFEYKGQVFKSISTLAVHIVGGAISGYVFFKLGKK